MSTGVVRFRYSRRSCAKRIGKVELEAFAKYISFRLFPRCVVVIIQCIYVRSLGFVHLLADCALSGNVSYVSSSPVAGGVKKREIYQYNGNWNGTCLLRASISLSTLLRPSAIARFPPEGCSPPYSHAHI